MAISISPAKRIIKKLLIEMGLIRPMSKGRHGFVGSMDLAEMKRQFQISFLKAQGLQPQHKLLDLGCGTLRGGIPIIEYLNDENYFGVDVRDEVLREARKELKEQNLEKKNPHIINLNESEHILSNLKFDFIWAFSVLIHMNDNILRETMKIVVRHLEPNGIFLGNVNIGKEDEDDWQGFPAVTRPLTFYEREAAACRLQTKVIGSLESLGHVAKKERQDEQIMLKIYHKL